MSDQTDFIRHWGWRWTKSGYADFGRVEVPPRPRVLQLTDRNDGSIWSVTFETSPVERISISQGIIDGYIRTRGSQIYDNVSGPVVDDLGQYVLFIRGGRLGVEFQPFVLGETFRSTELSFAMTSTDQRQINLDSDDVTVLHLGYIAP